MKILIFLWAALAYADGSKTPDVNVQQPTHAQTILSSNMGYFTVPQKQNSGPGVTLSQAATKPVESNLPQKTFGDPKAKVKITIYGAATCTHCAEYDREILPKIIEFASAGNFYLVFRSFIAHLPWDLAASKISWVHGEKEQYKYFSQIIHGQEEWLKPLFEYRTDEAKQKTHTEEKIKVALEAASQKLNKSQEEVKAVLLISGDEPTSLLKLFAINKLGLSIDELLSILNDQDLEKKLLLVTLDARKDDGNLLDYTPAIYVQTNGTSEQGVLQKVSLTYDDVLNIVAEHK